jgi:hypothetical protein
MIEASRRLVGILLIVFPTAFLAGARATKTSATNTTFLKVLSSASLETPFPSVSHLLMLSLHSDGSFEPARIVEKVVVL